MTTIIRNVGEASFERDVIETSRRTPVLVDFWAGWCRPCRALAPLLERLAAELVGRLVIVKVDTDVEKALAATYEIRGIPACKLFADGKVVDEFVGAMPEKAVRDFLAPHVANKRSRAKTSNDGSVDLR